MAGFQYSQGSHERRNQLGYRIGTQRTWEATMETTKVKEPDQSGDSIHKKRDAIWPLVLFYIHLNILGVYGIYVLLTSASWATILFSEFGWANQLHVPHNKWLAS